MTELSRLAFLLSGDRDAADDLAADALLAAWKQWERVRAADSSIAYVRGIVVNLASSRVRRLVRERSRLVLLRSDARSAHSHGPDTPAVIDLRRALQRLPRGQRACVVLRHGLGLSEAETAQALGISVGTVKSQTSKGAAQLRKHVAVSETAPIQVEPRR
jgi:RNA polymerase sigma-70 factor (sigma-E family)